VLPGVTQKESDLIPGIMRQLWVFLAYVAAAKLAIMLALPPGYASPIWPAAGIAMAATIIWGPSLTIAVFLGSIATNLRPDELMAHPVDQILLQLCLAMGTSIQAYVGSLLYHALVRRQPNQASPIRLTMEVSLLGPLACVTAATISSAALTVFHVIEPRSFMTNWIWWWMGDSFGAGVLGPLLLRLHSHLHPKQLRAKIAPYLIAPAGLSFLIVIGLIFHLNQSDSRNRQNLQQNVADFHQRLQQDMRQAQQDLEMQAEFSRNIDPLSIIERYPFSEHKGRHSIWVPRVALDERPSFEKSFGNAHLHFTILEKTSTGHLAPAGSRPTYWPMILKTPHEFNLLPTGFDLGSLPEIQQILQTAWENSETLASPLLTLSQNKKSVLLIKKGLSSQANSFKQGLFITIVPIDAFIKAALPSLQHTVLHIQIKSPGAAPEAIYQSWFGTEAMDTVLKRIPLYGNFQKALTIGAQTLLLQVDFPAEAFNSGRMSDPIFMTMLCILLAFTLNVLLISQQNRPTQINPQATAQHDGLLLQHEALRDADRNKANLLANISHQIKSPLHGILGLLDMLRASNLDHKQRISIDTIIANCQSMRLVLDDIHTYTSMEMGQLTLASDEFLVEDFLQDLTSIYELAAEERQNNFKAQIDLPNALRVQGDRRKLHRVLSHLLSDAIRRTQKGRISFRVALQGEQGLVFALESTRGFQDEVYDNDREFGNVKAYQPLEIYNLTICDRIVQAMGGCLTLERPGSLSSLITVTLPLPVIAYAAPSSASSDLQDVLVVDDNVINLTVASGLLVKLGYSVDTASNGREALEKVRLKRYDVIFMDCQMPHMDGYEATQHIRNSYRPEHGPLIIALTANTLDGIREQATQAGMDKVITKPISLEVLIKTVGYAKKMPSPSPTQAAPIMDFKAFSMGLGDDHDLMQTAVIRYFEEIDGIMDCLRAEIERGDLASTAKIAHTLKGMTSLFAAPILVEANRTLETAAKDGRIHEFAGHLERIENLTELLKMELNKILDDKNPSRKDVA